MSLSFSNLVEVMHAANISVYAGVLRNEFQNLLFDYYTDPYVELTTLTQKGVDGITNDYPATANAYMRSPCSNPNANLPYPILPINPGDMFNTLVAAKPPEAAPPLPLLQTADVIDPALPPVSRNSQSMSPASSGSNSTPAPAPKYSRNTKTSGNTCLITAAMVGVLAILGCNFKSYF